MQRRIITALGAIALVIGLGGCTGIGQTQTTYADLDREATSKDQLPASSIGDGSDGFTIDADSARLVAVQGDTEVFLASATEQGHDRICVFVFAADSPLRSCGGESFAVSDSVNEFRVLPDAVADTELDPDEGWTRLSDNVFTRPVVADIRDTQ